MPGLKGVAMHLRQEGIGATARAALAASFPERFGIYSLASFGRNEVLRPIMVETSVEKLRELRAPYRRLPSEFHRDLAGGGQKCFTAVENGRLAGVLWILDERYPSRFLNLGDGDAELAYLYVLPEFRGQGIAKALIREACRLITTAGYRQLFAVIHCRNLASQRSVQSVGFQKIAELSRPALFGPRYLTDEGRVESWWEALVRAASLQRSARERQPHGEREKSTIETKLRKRYAQDSE